MAYFRLELLADHGPEYVLERLDANRNSWIAEQADRHKRREEWQAEIRKRKERALEFVANNHH